MTETAIVYSGASNAVEAASELASRISEKLPGRAPDALILFASPAFDQPLLIRSLHEAVQPGTLVGASSAGEFTHTARGQGLCCAMAIRSDSMAFRAGIGRGLHGDRAAAARQLTSRFAGVGNPQYAYRSALIMTDALAGHADDLVDQLTLATSGSYQFFGGGAGDDAQFRRTAVFCGTEVATDAAVGLEILSQTPVGVGVSHGWQPASKPMRVTAAAGARLLGLNGFPAAQVFQQHAEETGQRLDPAAPTPFFLHNILGMQTAAGHRLRVPLAVNDDGSITCAAEIPQGAIVHIMRTSDRDAVEAASSAARTAVLGLEGQKPQAALFFDCVATRLRMGDVFGFELQALADQLGDAAFMGCNTQGQIARAPGQFSGFHNCTAVVCVFPQ